MKQRKTRLLFCMLAGGVASGILLGILSAQPAEAQYVIRNSVLGTGLGSLLNAQCRFTVTLGQPVIGRMTGGGTPSYGALVGFWYAQQSGLTGIKQTKGIPTEYRLEQNYPNPFNPATTILYQLPGAGTVTLVVFDGLGRQVVELVSGVHQPGYYSVRWDAMSHASGIYFARFTVVDEAGRLQFNGVNKLVLMK